MSEHPPPTTWPAYLDGALDGSQRSAAERHLAGCPVCRAELETQRALRHRLERLARHSLARSSAAATKDAWTAVRPRLNRRWAALFRPVRRLVYGLGAAAALVLFVLGLVALFSQQAGPTASETQASPTSPIPTPTHFTDTYTLTVNLDALFAHEIDEGVIGDELVPVLYTIELYNHGPGVAANVRVTDVIPSPLTYLEGSVSGGAVYDPETNVITWAGSLGAGETHTIDFVCGAPKSLGWPGTPAINEVLIDDGLHPPFTRSLTVNFTPWPTVVPTPGPAPSRTPWATPTYVPIPEPSSAVPPSVTPLTATRTPWLTPTQWEPPTTPTPWAETRTPAPTTSTPWVTPTPWDTPISTPTPWLTPTPRDTPPVTPTPWITPTPWNTPPVTPTPGDGTSTPAPTPTPWAETITPIPP